MHHAAAIVGSHVPRSFRARASGVFRRACYLSEGARITAVLLAEGAGPAPHGVVVPVPPEGFAALVEPGALAELSDGTLTIQRTSVPNVAWTLVGAARYDGEVWDRDRKTPALASREALGEISTALVDHECSLARRPNSLAAAARTRVGRLVDELAEAVCADDRMRASLAVGHLVGLGPGLTPSGDDALVGFLAALWAATGSGGIVAEAVSRAGTDATTDVSRSFLELAVRGRFAEPLASLARTISEGASGAVRIRTRECLALGASSGADGLVGLLGGHASLETDDRTIQRGA